MDDVPLHAKYSMLTMPEMPSRMTRRQLKEREQLRKQVEENIDIWMEDITDSSRPEERPPRPADVPKLWDKYISGPIWMKYNQKENVPKKTENTVQSTDTVTNAVALNKRERRRLAQQENVAPPRVKLTKQENAAPSKVHRSKSEQRSGKRHSPNNVWEEEEVLSDQLVDSEVRTTVQNATKHKVKKQHTQSEVLTIDDFQEENVAPPRVKLTKQENAPPLKVHRSKSGRRSGKKHSQNNVWEEEVLRDQLVDSQVGTTVQSATKPKVRKQHTQSEILSIDNFKVDTKNRASRRPKKAFSMPTPPESVNLTTESKFPTKAKIHNRPRFISVKENSCDDNQSAKISVHGNRENAVKSKSSKYESKFAPQNKSANQMPKGRDRKVATDAEKKQSEDETKLSQLESKCNKLECYTADILARIQKLEEQVFPEIVHAQSDVMAKETSAYNSSDVLERLQRLEDYIDVQAQDVQAQDGETKNPQLQNHSVMRRIVKSLRKKGKRCEERLSNMRKTYAVLEQQEIGRNKFLRPFFVAIHLVRPRQVAENNKE